MKYMLDTNVCIGLIRKKPPSLIQRLKASGPGDIVISTITIAELVHGAQKSNQVEQNTSALEQFLLPFEIADFDQRASLAYGAIRSYLERAGNTISSMDMLIGAHALSLDVTLVTNNTREFKRITSLKVEDWIA